MTRIVVLILITWNCDAGIKLAEETRTFERSWITDNLIEECRIYGVERARELSERFRGGGYPNASSNVDCHWEDREGAPA